MKPHIACVRIASAFALLLADTTVALAQNYPAAKEGSWVARDFKFHTGEVMPELKLAYRTVGEPSGSR
jgi:homoserine O-acetyltransferase